MNDSNATGTAEIRRTAIATPVSPAKAWYTVSLLTALFILSFIDRSILALLAAPVSESLDLTNRELALLLGLGFALVYSIGGVPLAQLIDTQNRKVVVAVGVTIWSLATMLSSMATGFGSLLLLRCGVALGEAVLTPAAVSLIADLFQREKRSLPMSVYLSAGSFMSIGSYVVGAMAYDLAEGMRVSTGLEPWQLTFVFVGAPGIVLAAIFALTAANPPRTASKDAGKDDMSWEGFYSYLRARWKFFVPLIMCAGVYTLYGLAVVTWIPTVMVREQGMSLSDAGYILGWVGIPSALAGTFLWPIVAQRIDRWKAKHGVPIVLLLASIMAGPLYAGAIYLGGTAMYVTLAIGVFFGAAFAVLPPIGIQLFGPQRMRARMAALNLLIIGLLGYGLSPLAAVELGALLGSGEEELSSGLIWLCLLTSPVIIALASTLVAQVGRADLQS